MKSLGSIHLYRTERFLWAAMLVALPVTSFRFMPFMGSGSQVRPLSLLPAALLLLVLLFRSIRERRVLFWSKSFQPLLIFVLIFALSSAVGFLLVPPDLYSYTYAGRLLRSWVTLGVGIVFLVVPMCMNQSEEDLKFTFKWLYVGFAGTALWSGVQLSSIYLLPIRSLVDSAQIVFSMAGLSPNNRISGLALEPSWLANQVITIYLPWAFAAIAKDYFWNKRRWQLLLILAVCIFLVVFTFSRGGILTALLVMVFTFFIAGWDRIKHAWKWFVAPLRKDQSLRLDIGRERVLRILVILVIFVGLIGGARALSGNQYFAQIWQSDKSNLVEYFVDIYAGPRLAYAWAGWAVFEAHPWIGVGPGAVGLYMHQALPDWSHFNISEIAQLLSPDNQVYPNVKNLYMRLLAETGIFGFWAFMAFYLLFIGWSLRLLRSKQKVFVFVGTAGLLAIFSIGILNLTLDSLAMPDIWLSLGMVIGMADSMA